MAYPLVRLGCTVIMYMGCQVKFCTKVTGTTSDITSRLT